MQIRNTTGAAVSLRGWVLVDVANHKYTFGTFTLGRGKTVTVRTGKGTNTSANRYQWRDPRRLQDVLNRQSRSRQTL